MTHSTDAGVSQSGAVAKPRDIRVCPIDLMNSSGNSGLLDLNHIVRDLQLQVQQKLARNGPDHDHPADPDESAFSEFDYLHLHPDVAEAVASGWYASGLDHWLKHGQAEGRRALMTVLERVQATRKLIERYRQTNDQLGSLPPVPPTIRGRLGSLVMKLFNKLAFWHTAQLRGINRVLIENLETILVSQEQIARDLQPDASGEDFGRRIDSIQRLVNDLQTQLRADLEAIHRLQNRTDSALKQERSRGDMLENRLLTLSEQYSAVSESVGREISDRDLTNRRIRELWDLQSATRQHVEAETQLLRNTLALHRTDTRQKTTLLKGVIRDLRQMVDRLDERLTAETGAREGLAASSIERIEAVRERLTDCLNAEIGARETFEYKLAVEMTGLRRAVDKVSAEQPHVDGVAMDLLYLEFENRFRGSRDDIKERQRAYLPHVLKAAEGRPAFSVLDLGCGRGEWLELLRESGVAAKGIDRNTAMIALCREHGLDVEEHDALAYLSALQDASIGAITSSHVIEHLPFTTVLSLLGHAMRVLQAGGVLILETPNPANLQVGAKTFYSDPTHRNPVPSETLSFLVESAGFHNMQVIPLHPYPAESLLRDDGAEMATRLNHLLYGPQDYVLIARKP